ncbi:single-stranded-DNA-specific exonuclease RecJ [Candidatus Parcubacteria bacterium]|nr:single-stranded-DNA-specific exonuclease RecJ [Candidatus Parcubacteria bacterium]
MQKKWLINKKYPVKFGKKFPEFTEVVLQLLWDRNLKTQEQIDEFFNPDYETDLHDPYLMKDMKKAVKRIYEAIEKNEKILVYGDYDVDGITSSAIVVNTLIELKSAISKIEKAKAREFIKIYIPDRETEGYGLNKKAIEKAKENKTDLIITVDCGISSAAEIETANKLGIDVIITDHHHPPEKIPKALAVINPKQKNCKYPFKELAGVGVAFKVAQALIKNLENYNSEKSKSKKPQATSHKLNSGFEKWLLDLVVLGTVADCVGLIGENRTLSKYGLLVINKTKRIGLKKLVSMAGLVTRENGNVQKKKIIDTTAISFILAPRLNAAGRMDHANTSYQLLIAESETQAEELVSKLEKNNYKRQQLTEKIIQETKSRIGKYKTALPKIIIESDPEWKIGVVGLVAGKLADEYARPFLILRESEDESAGSGRSILKFNLIKAIEKCKDTLINFGGHSQAAGLKIKNSNLEKFRKKINSIADEILKEDDLVPFVEIDFEINHEQINWQLIDEIEKFKPFGQENKNPVFVVKKLEVHEVRSVGNGNSHLKLCFKAILEDKSVKYFPAIAFRLGKLAEEMPACPAGGPDGKPGLRWGDIVDVVFQLEINEWNGNRELQMNVLDLKIGE